MGIRPQHALIDQIDDRAGDRVGQSGCELLRKNERRAQIDRDVTIEICDRKRRCVIRLEDRRIVDQARERSEQLRRTIDQPRPLPGACCPSTRKKR